MGMVLMGSDKVEYKNYGNMEMDFKLGKCH